MSYLLTHKNMNGTTILHKACHIGNLDIVREILRLAGPDNLDVLKFIINDEDNLNMTPLLRLC